MKTIYDKPDIQVNQSIFFRALGTTYKVLSKSVSGSAAISGTYFGTKKHWSAHAQTYL